MVIDLDSTICEVYGNNKQGAAYGYTKQFGYHPLLATRAGTSEILFARMRKGSAGSSRGVVRFIDELVAMLKRAGATGAKTVRADSGFWSWKLIDRLDAHDVKWSITVALQPAVRATIEQIPDAHWQDIDYTTGGQAQVAETTYVTGKGHRQRRVRLVVRRTRLTEPAQRRLWPDWRHHAFITNRDDLDTVEARPLSIASTPSSSSPSAISKKAPAPNTSPPGTTTPMPHGWPAPCWPTTSATGPPSSPTSHR